MHVNRLILNLLLVFVACQLEAQTNYLKGTIVNNKNDSVDGFIDYRNWEVNPKSIHFKKKITDAETVILPTQIKMFTVSGDLYETHTIPLKDDLSEASRDVTPSEVVKLSDTTLFLRCQVKGYWSLYSCSMGSGKLALYVLKESDTLRFLVYRREYDNYSSVGLRFKTNNGYRRQLLKYFYDYPELSKRIIDASYRISKIQQIVADYNAHFSDRKPTTYTALLPNSIFHLHAFVGVNKSFLAISTMPDLLSTPRIPDQTIMGYGFDLGISAQWFLARRLNKVSFVADVNFKTMNLSRDFKNDEASSQTTFDNSYLRLYTQGRYQLFKTRNLCVSANAGVVLSYSIKKDNTYSSAYGTYVRRGLMFPKDDFKAFNVGLTAGLMAQYKSFALELRGERNGGMSPYNTLSSQLLSFNAFFYYRLY